MLVDSKGSIALWLQSGLYEAKACEGHTGSVYALALNEAGNFLAAGSTEGTIRISDTRSHAVVASLKGHTENIRCYTCLQQPLSCPLRIVLSALGVKSAISTCFNWQCIGGMIPAVPGWRC